jgi:hypothetical protein
VTSATPCRLIAAVGGVAVLLMGCSGGATITTAGTSGTASAPGDAASGVAAAGSSAPRLTTPQGWTATVFASGAPRWSNPAAIDRDSDHVWVVYQGASTTDGGPTNGVPSPPSTVVDYDLLGQVRQAWTIPGRAAGLRSDPANHRVWVTTNLGTDHLLEIIDAANPTPQVVSMPPPPHGGGYGDLAFVGGLVYVSCSHPDQGQFDNGANPFPAAGTITVFAPTATVTPVLPGSGTAVDGVSGSGRPYNLTDPDRLAADNHGNLVLTAPADALLMTIRNPGTDTQRLVATPLDNRAADTVWTSTSAGRFLIVDGAQDTIYSVEWGGMRGMAFSEVSTDPGRAGFVGTVDLRTGAIRPMITGLSRPSGLAFIAEP